MAGLGRVKLLNDPFPPDAISPDGEPVQVRQSIFCLVRLGVSNGALNDRRNEREEVCRHCDVPAVERESETLCGIGDTLNRLRCNRLGRVACISSCVIDLRCIDFWRKGRCICCALSFHALQQTLAPAEQTEQHIHIQT